MSKVDIKRLDSVTKNDTTATEQINDNFKALQAAIENTVSRDGTVPNYMDADLDLNSYRIINAAAPVEGKDVVTLEYFEEKAGGAIEAAAEAKASASKAASSAQSALVASNNAIGQLAQAEGLLTAADGQLEDTKQYVNAAKADIEDTKNTAIETINSTVSTAKSDINASIDEATMNITDIVSDAEGSITTIAVTEANKAIANAAQEATDTATANLNSYVDGTVKPSLQTYVDQAQADANSAATSMEQAALSATAASEYASNASADADNAAESAGLAANSASEAALHNLKNKITNCITEIPQDIKLELVDGVLTLKAGSKVYVPNGAGVFDVIITKTDITRTISDNGSYFISLTTDIAPVLAYGYVSVCFSGDTAPSSAYSLWYNTSSNIIQNPSGNRRSFPIAIVTVSNSSITSIDQVFNGFGYIGSTVFALPGVKGLIPNGRNADGSLKNNEVTLDDVKVQNRTDWGSALRYFWLGFDGTLQSSIASDITYDAERNKNYNTNGNFVVGLICGEVTTVDGRITSITPKLPFRAVDYNDFENELNTKQNISNLSQTLDSSTTKYPSNAAVKAAIDAKDSLPAQAGNSGKFLTTNGTTASWADVFSAINNITKTSGKITIEANKIYTISVSGATTFSLATPNNTNVFNQIKVMMKVTGTPTITWGTTNFFNKSTPEIEKGSYDVYFDYDNLLGAWVCGVLPKGAAK